LRETVTMPHPDSQIVLLVIAGLIAVALLLQAFALMAIFFGLRKAAISTRQQIDEMRSTILPFCRDARDCFTRVAPKIEQTTTDLAELAHTLRTQSDDVKSVTAEIIKSTRRQAERIDNLATTVLDAADRAVTFTSETVVRPMRKFTGIMAAAKAVVDVLRSPNGRRVRPTGKPGDPEMFV
jgi:methyl-accepting chemotaxis protein